MGDSREIRQQELAQLMLQKARQDLALVLKVADSKEVADEIIGFHIQQTIEKAIKAALTRLGVQYEYTHDLSVLFQQAEKAGLALPATLNEVEELTDFAVQFRYTLYPEQALNREVETTLAEEFIEWAYALIEIPVLSEQTGDEKREE